LHAEIGAKSETKLAALATLPCAILFQTQTVLHAFVPVVTIVERRADGARPLRGRISRNFPRNRALVSSERLCDLSQRMVSREHPLDGFALIEQEMFVL
jgi:hypothetical protein